MRHDEGLTPAHEAALRLLAKRLSGRVGLVWALTGSTSFALQGMDVPAHDIDVIADRQSAEAIAGLLSDCCVRPMEASSAQYIRSFFGRFVVGGIDVDLMGDPERLGMDGAWQQAVPLPPLIRHVSFRGLRLPVLDLAFEEQAYRLLRRDARADDIAAFLRRGAGQAPAQGPRQGGAANPPVSNKGS